MVRKSRSKRTADERDMFRLGPRVKRQKISYEYNESRLGTTDSAKVTAMIISYSKIN